MESFYDSTILLLGIYLKVTKSLCQRDICIPMSAAALFTVIKTWKQLQCPLMDKRIKKYGEYLL